MSYKDIILEKEQDAVLDHSGLYTLINRTKNAGRHASKSKTFAENEVLVRVDIMKHDDTPLHSFTGRPNAVRKAVITFIEQWTEDNNFEFSAEHASYIGYEVQRAFNDADYVQD